MPQSNRAVDGRKLKKRRQGEMLDEIVTRVQKTKDGLPVPADVIKTATNTEYNEAIPYMVAWRAINGDVIRRKKAAVMSFQLIIPYLEELRRCNPSSLIGYSRDQNCNMVDLHFFIPFANDVLKTARPVVALDAAHLRSEYKGVLYIASGLSGGKDVYPIGFMISMGNEDGPTSTKMLKLLKEACPIICEQGVDPRVNHDRREEENANDASICDESLDLSVNDGDEEEYNANRRRTKFIFISDRDKGLKEALKEVFPNVLEMSCARHIQANVCNRYGKAFHKHVMAMAKTYSVLYYNTVLEQVRTMKASAFNYIVKMTNNADGEPLKTLWSNCQWNRTPKRDLPNDPLPPRFGIVTSNTAESVNSMFNAARNLPWMDCVETIIDVMIRRICECRKKYAGEEGPRSVPHVRRLMKSRWKKTASISILELEHECGVYQATTCESGGGMMKTKTKTKTKWRTLMIRTNRSQNERRREERRTFLYNTGRPTLSGLIECGVRAVSGRTRCCLVAMRVLSIESPSRRTRTTFWRTLSMNITHMVACKQCSRGMFTR